MDILQTQTPCRYCNFGSRLYYFSDIRFNQWRRESLYEEKERREAVEKPENERKSGE